MTANRKLDRGGIDRRLLLKLGAAGAVASFAAPNLLRGAFANTPLVLPPYDPAAPSGKAPSDLPRAVAYLSVTNQAELFVNIGTAIKKSAEARGLQYLTSTYEGDSTKFVQQLEGYLARGVGGLFFFSTDPEATRPLQQRALDAGIFVQGMVASYCHQVIDINQYKSGVTQGSAAAAWINKTLGGKAQVVNFNEDETEMLRPRHQGIRDALKAGGAGIEVVTDVTAPRTAEAGLEAMNSILQAHPGVNVVIGGAGVMAGVYAAFDARGRSQDPSVYLTGMSPGKGDFDLIRKHNIYRAGVAQPFELWAYIGGQSAADWLEGKSVPQGLTCDSIVVDTPEGVDSFVAAMADPAATCADKAKLSRYVKLFGNISYATRDHYTTAQWIPE
jgi:ribose transport system substrate-binding protein